MLTKPRAHPDHDHDHDHDHATPNAPRAITNAPESRPKRYAMVFIPARTSTSILDSYRICSSQSPTRIRSPPHTATAPRRYDRMTRLVVVAAALEESRVALEVEGVDWTR
jgi:hypothetical protein